MSDNFLYVQAQSFTLAGAGATIGDTSVTLSSFKQIDGTTNLTMTDFGSIGYMTLEPNSGTQEEQISFTGVSQNASGTATLTGVKTVLFVSPYTESSGLAKTHAGGTIAIVSNTSGFYNKLTGKDDDETITGLWQFPNGANTPILGTSYVAPTIQWQVASKGYVDAVASFGAPLSTNLVNGILKLSVAAASAGAPIAVGDNDTRVPTINMSTYTTGYLAAQAGNNTDIAVGSGNKYVTQTGLQHSAEQYAADSSVSANTITVTLSPIPTSYTAGMVVRVKVANATTSATTINVNSLGAKTVKKYVAGAVADLTTNDILAGQIVTLAYDGTYMVMQSPSAIVPSTTYTPVWKSGTTTKNAADASTTQTIAHGLGIIPKYVKITALVSNNATTAAYLLSTTTYNGSTQSSLSLYGTASNAVATTFTISTASSVSGDATGVVTFDATNISIAWTKTSSPTGTYTLLWEAFT